MYTHIEKMIDREADLLQYMEDMNNRFSRHQLEMRAYTIEEAPLYLEVIRKAFEPVAESLGMSKENFPASGAFVDQSDLNKLILKQGRVFGLFRLNGDDKLIGTIAICPKDKQVYKIEKLAVLPEYKHLGYGSYMMSFAESCIKILGGERISLGAVGENTLLIDWYKDLAYQVKKTKAYKQSGYHIVFMEKILAVSKLKGNILIFLLTHEREKGRPTNTGRLIKETLPSHTEIVYWSRVAPNEKLLEIINNQAYQPILVFPVEASEERRIKPSEMCGEGEKTKVLIILDGIWKESKKILRQSPYLKKLPFVSLENLEKTRYTLRRNKEIDHICTIEVGIELLKLCNEESSAQMLNQVFESFLQNYNKSTQLKHKNLRLD